jgi:nitroimidazol reductase NimA-like FMN-containing flavoprotein (pyridoxamine 5'-phosphate oxidase superfamily)
MLCRIAFKGVKHPYVALFKYVFMNGSLYLHFSDYGKKKRLLVRDKRVCVEIESYRSDLSEYRFVMLRGTLKVVKDPHERAEAFKRIAEEGEKKAFNELFGSTWH